MTYDEDGNLTKVTSTGLSEESATYNGGDLIGQMTGGNGYFDYTYDDNHNVTKIISQENSSASANLTQEIIYDDFGNAEKTTLKGTASSYLETSAAYSDDGNRLVSVTDSTGLSVTYGYPTSAENTSDKISLMTGQPTSVETPNGNYTSAYDAFGRTTNTIVDNAGTLDYTYDKGNLETIQRSVGSIAQTYTLTYDRFGNTTGIDVGGIALAEYAYDFQNGNLKNQAYGNGDSVSYTYDILNRVIKTEYSSGRALNYTYNGDGQLYRMTDDNATSSTGDDVTYLYSYDSLKRLISSEQKVGSSTVLRTSQTYNENNQLTAQGWEFASKAYNEAYTYDWRGLLTDLESGSGLTLNFTYDSLRRLQKTTAGSLYTRTYSYSASTKTDTQVTGVAYSGNVSKSFAYTYDDETGYIESETSNGVTSSYEYDSLGQLTRATIDGTEYLFQYDGAGNITHINNVEKYQYANSSWRDLLTSYDGEAIAYEGQTYADSSGTVSGTPTSGNPISYYNGTRWTLDWENGRELSSASTSTTIGTVTEGTDVDYAYDSSGLRVSKTVVTSTITPVLPGVSRFDISYASMTMGNSLAINFAFEQGHMDDWTGCYVKIEKVYADDRENLVETVPFADWRSTTIDGDAYYYVTFNGIAAKEMTDNVYVTVYDSSDNAISNTKVETVRDQATRVLNKTTTSSLEKTMVVDMLNYGAAAQTYFTYGTADLANSGLTDEQQALASTPIACTNTRTSSGNFAVSNVSLKSNIQLLFAFRDVTQDMNAVVTYTNHNGTAKTINVSGSEFTANGSFYVVTVNTLAVADARQDVTCVVYDGETEVARVTDSVESYTARATGDNAVLFQALMQFADSAYAYFHDGAAPAAYALTLCQDSDDTTGWVSFDSDAVAIAVAEETDQSSNSRAATSYRMTHNYIYAGGKLLRETYGDTTLDFFYDNSGAPFAMNYIVGSNDPVTYYYILNLQGDVVMMVDANGATVASYTYDPYGNILTATGSMAEINPLRYRGYYYDSETGFYYLQSRYYDPAIGRFINADSFASTGQGFLGYNMFAYCNNNPICFIDDNGCFAVWYLLKECGRWGFIHECVQNHIIKNNSGMDGELWLKSKQYGVLIGRADLMNSEGEIWEIKHGGKNPEQRRLLASLQVMSYVGSIAVRNNTHVIGLGGTNAFKGSFIVNIGKFSYLVTYETPSYGVVLYYVSETEYQENPDYVLNYYEALAQFFEENPMAIPCIPFVSGYGAEIPGNNRYYANR